MLILVRPCPAFTLLAELASAVEHVQGVRQVMPTVLLCQMSQTDPTGQGPRSVPVSLSPEPPQAEGPRHLHRIPRLSEAPWEVP